MIDASLIGDKANYNFSHLFTESHWVVYEGNLRLVNAKEEPTKELDKVAKVYFDVYTWGINPEDAKWYEKALTSEPYKTSPPEINRFIKDFKSIGISTQSWKKNYYGFIAAT